MKAFLKVFILFVAFPLGSAGIALAALGIYTGWVTPEVAIKWVADMLPWIIGLSAFISASIVSVKDRHALLELIKPRILIEFHGTNTYYKYNKAGDGILASIKLTGLCHKRVDFHVYCSASISTKPGSQTLLIETGDGTHRFLAGPEPHLLPVLRYDWNIAPPFIVCLVAANHMLTTQEMTGGEFMVTISAYGEMEPAHIQLHFWADDNKFCVEEVKPVQTLNELRAVSG